MADEMTFADVEIGGSSQMEVVAKGSGLDLRVDDVTIRVTDQTDMGLLVRVMRALADGQV
jgi:hypothetical protein